MNMLWLVMISRGARIDDYKLDAMRGELEARGVQTETHKRDRQTEGREGREKIKSQSELAMLSWHGFLPTSTSQKSKTRRRRNPKALIEGHGTPWRIPRRSDESRR